MSDLTWRIESIGHHKMAVLRNEDHIALATVNLRSDGKYAASIRGKGYHVLEDATTMEEAQAVAIVLLRMN